MKKTKLIVMVSILLILLSGYATAENNTPQVELYITSWCPYCKNATQFFRSKGIPFTVYDIEKDRGAALRKDQLDSRKGVPFAVINGHKIHGFSEAVYEQALKSPPK